MENIVNVNLFHIKDTCMNLNGVILQYQTQEEDLWIGKEFKK